MILDIEPGELVVSLGPSGSGKTTLLRMIAGLESIDVGTLTIDGVRSENLAPGRRYVAMVFQNYALYPTYDGRGEHGPLVKERSATSQLSGGQRQRVAIGRAIVKERLEKGRIQRIR
ncbi:ATP-binding cassette domain-containing protein [Mesorhizobium abyssinicae]|uniref:ATP-binding cassette domain-containing protein n=1 Tax=Mesorhizobium abyssinicae TaxID=1209958 RepID=A0ABU5AMN4_9HYPH|nr:ATP-binding cassette domain-containing protein [Mesorhizobium abyssinicae]MDX8538559.1 ATP-binding cassette domain-containing protein [Mesorhizobium abyssinicae]